MKKKWVKPSMFEDKTHPVKGVSNHRIQRDATLFPQGWVKAQWALIWVFDKNGQPALAECAIWQDNHWQRGGK